MARTYSAIPLLKFRLNLCRVPLNDLQMVNELLAERDRLRICVEQMREQPNLLDWEYDGLDKVLAETTPVPDSATREANFAEARRLAAKRMPHYYKAIEAEREASRPTSEAIDGGN